MKGERLQWFELASHLCMSLQRCMMETTSSEFVDWKYYLERDVNAFHREDYYLARISMQIADMFSKSPQKLKDFLIKFTSKKVVTQGLIFPINWKFATAKSNPLCEGPI